MKVVWLAAAQNFESNGGQDRRYTADARFY